MVEHRECVCLNVMVSSTVVDVVIEGWYDYDDGVSKGGPFGGAACEGAKRWSMRWGAKRV